MNDIYQRNKLLYLGEAVSVFPLNPKYYLNPSLDYVSYNIFQIITDTFVNLMLSETPILKFADPKNQELFNLFAVEEQFWLKIREMAKISSYAGESVARLGLIDGFINFDVIENNIWEPEIDPNRPNREARANSIIYTKVVGKKKFRFKETYFKDGKIKYQMENGEKSDLLTIFSKELSFLSQSNPVEVEDGYIIDTQTNAPLFFRNINSSILGVYHGFSDYTTAIIAKAFNINFNLNQIQYVIKKHADPKMFVSEKFMRQAVEKAKSQLKKVLGAEGDAEMSLENIKEGIYKGIGGVTDKNNIFNYLNSQQILNQLEYYPVETNELVPNYLTWDGKLEESSNQIKRIKEMILEEAGVAKVLLEPELALGNVSGVALLRLIQPTIHKAFQKKEYLKYTIQGIVYSYLALYKVTSGQNITPEYPSVEFSDGLVNNLTEEIENQEKLLSLNLTNRQKALMSIYGMSSEQAEAAINEVEEENNLFNLNNNV